LLANNRKKTDHMMAVWSNAFYYALFLKYCKSISTLLIFTVTLGLYSNRSAGRIKGNQATFDNSQRNNLRSFMRVSSVVFGLSFSLVRARKVNIYIKLCVYRYTVYSV